MRIISIAVLLVIFCPAPSHSQSRPEEIPTDLFASLNGYTATEISPNGETLAYLYPVDGRQNLVIEDLETEARQVIPPIGGLDFTWLEWANDETLVFSMRMSAARKGWIIVDTEETRLIAINIKTNKVTPLIKPAMIVGRTGSRTAREYYGEPQIQDEVIDWMPEDPDHILVSLDEDFDGRDEVRRVNVNTGSYRIHRKSIDGVQHWVVDQSGEVRLGYGYRLGESRMVFKDAKGDWLTLDDTDWYQNGWRPRAFTADKEIIIVVGYGEHDTAEARTLNTSTGEFVDTLFSNPNYDLYVVLRHPYSRERMGVSHTDHRTRIDYFDESFAKLQSSLDRAIPDSRNYIRSFSKDMRKLVVHSSNSREPGMLLLWDRDTKSMDPIGWFNENLDPDMLADVNAVEYESADGTIIPAYLTLPAGADAGALPAIVLPHGGPASRTDKSYWFLSQFLVSRGYAVLQPNFRGSDGYGWEFREAGRGQWGGIMQDDVDAGARWLIDEGIADADRICIIGWSYGGYSAAIGLVNSPDLYRCGVGINGVYNLPQFIADSNEYVGGTVWSRHIGLEGESSRSVSPYHQVERFDSPFLIIHAEDDHRVRVGQADQMYKALEKNEKQAKLVKVDHGGHLMVNAASRKRLLDEIESFLRDNNAAR